MRNTVCRTAARSRGSSAQRGHPADALPPATSRSGSPRIGSEKRWRTRAAEWLRYVEHDRDVKPSTFTDYRSTVGRLLPTFGSVAIEDVTAERIEAWRAGLGVDRAQPLSNRTRNKALTVLGGIMERARKVNGLPSNPARDVEKLRERNTTIRVPNQTLMHTIVTIHRDPPPAQAGPPEDDRA